MLNLDLYLHGSGSIAPAAAINEPVTKLLCQEPDYTAYIPPMQLRRMSKAVRMGIGASKACMQSTGITQPDALSIGTAMGCLADTEVFLSKMVAQEERMLTPTAFIQSTHNTVGGQIALLAGCYGHNMTYVHRGHSFEHAVINTKLYLQDHPGETLLTGGIDELTETSHLLMQRAGIYSAGALTPAETITQETNGCIAGEGASFFTISETKGQARLKITGLHLFTAADPEAAYHELASQLPIEADLVLTGRNGDLNHRFYDRLPALLPGAVFTSFKQYCGEYATASAFGLSLLFRGLESGVFPEGFFAGPAPARLERIALINHYCDHYSCWLLEAC